MLSDLPGLVVFWYGLGELSAEPNGVAMQTALYPCEPWPIDPRCCPNWPEDPDEWTERHRTAQWLATVELWRAVGGIIGLCRAVVRPCLDECRRQLNATWSGWMVPNIRDGQWYNNACGCDDDCSCSRLCTVTLPGPVWQVISVRIDGQVLPGDQYRQIVGDRLAGVGDGCWPTCQDFRLPDDEGFTVEYLRGQPVREDAIRAVSMLACAKLRECAPDGGDGCGQLPAGTTSVTRDGISFRLDGDEESFNSGIKYVNDWVASINPYALTEVPSVWSPDVPEPVVFYEGPVGQWRC